MTMHMAKGLEYDIVHIAGCDEFVFPLVRRGAMELQTPAEKKAHMEEERRLFYVGATRAKKKLSLYTAARRFWQGSIQPFHTSRFLEEMDPATVSIEEDPSLAQQQDFRQAPPAWQGRPGSGASGNSYGNAAGKPSFGGKTYNTSYGSGNARTHVTGGGSKPVTIRTVYKTPVSTTPPASSPAPRDAGPRVVYDEYSQENLSYSAGMKVRHARFGMGRVLSSSGSGENTRVEVQFHDGVVRKLILKYASLDILGER
jgi:DNA helicase-2/ATP-dependent DNA helicase PcrA